MTLLSSPPAAFLAAGDGFNSTPAAIPGVTTLQTFIGYAAWIATAACVIGLIVAGAMMAVSHQRGSSEHSGRLGGVALACVLLGAASPLVGSLLGFNLFTANAQAIPGLTAVQTIIGYIAWGAAAACLIGLIIAASKLAVAYRHGEHGGAMAGVAAGCLIVGGASTIVASLV